MFCPPSTNDEEKDLSIQDRIRKLSWVNAHHLDCCISETSIEVRDLVYTAINDLLGNNIISTDALCTLHLVKTLKCDILIYA